MDWDELPFNCVKCGNLYYAVSYRTIVHNIRYSLRKNHKMTGYIRLLNWINSVASFHLSSDAYGLVLVLDYYQREYELRVRPSGWPYVNLHEIRYKLSGVSLRLPHSIKQLNFDAKNSMRQSLSLFCIGFLRISCDSVMLRKVDLEDGRDRVWKCVTPCRYHIWIRSHLAGFQIFSVPFSSPGLWLCFHSLLHIYPIAYPNLVKKQLESLLLINSSSFFLFLNLFIASCVSIEDIFFIIFFSLKILFFFQCCGFFCIHKQMKGRSSPCIYSFSLKSHSQFSILSKWYVLRSECIPLIPQIIFTSPKVCTISILQVQMPFPKWKKAKESKILNLLEFHPLTSVSYFFIFLTFYSLVFSIPKTHLAIKNIPWLLNKKNHLLTFSLISYDHFFMKISLSLQSKLINNYSSLAFLFFFFWLMYDMDFTLLHSHLLKLFLIHLKISYLRCKLLKFRTLINFLMLKIISSPPEPDKVPGMLLYQPIQVEFPKNLLLLKFISVFKQRIRSHTRTQVTKLGQERTTTQSGQRKTGIQDGNSSYKNTGEERSQL
ncbi:hypothetical protein VP01_32g3 [Puccinia sorghi]|uniref:Uncharacterized protein n=1 Tax=Puccinia sorghi TaxID=27349 RepID=A0A0L6UYA1_9BASI|nr:hypothetical protein VP01_32g3 [Puccinia sorghi]